MIQPKRRFSVCSSPTFSQLLQKLPVTPFAHVALPAVEPQAYPLLESDDWSRLLQACQPQQPTDGRAERAAARNCAILWILFETGMQATEVCRLRLGDVNREQRELVMRGKGAQVRLLTLGQEGWRHLLTYLDDYRLKVSTGSPPAGDSADYLFLSQTGQPLTKSAITLLFGRLTAVFITVERYPWPKGRDSHNGETSRAHPAQ